MIPQILRTHTETKWADYTIHKKRTRTRTATDEQPRETPKRDDAVNHYRYLGSDITPGWLRGREKVRNEIRRQTIAVVSLIGRVPYLTRRQMVRMMTAAVTGMVSYRARSTPMRWEDAEAIETARANAMRRAGCAPSEPRLQMYANEHDGGLAHKHAYAAAAASYLDQIDRALWGDEGEPHREAVASMIAETCWRLGCRRESPLTWHPEHAIHELSDELMIEAWIKMKLLCGCRAMRTGQAPGGALADKRWRVEGQERTQCGPTLYEKDERHDWQDAHACPYSKKIAECNIVWWSDVTEWSTGEWLTWKELQTRSAGRLQGARDQEEYDTIIRALNAPRNADAVRRWRLYVKDATPEQHPVSQKAHDSEQHNKWDHIDITGARRTATSLGSWEYETCDQTTGKREWIRAYDIPQSEHMENICAAAQEKAYVPCSMHEALYAGCYVGGEIARQARQVARKRESARQAWLQRGQCSNCMSAE